MTAVAPPAETLDLSRLIGLLHGAGFRTDTRQFLAANELLLLLAAHGKPLAYFACEGKCDELARHLGPIFATSPQEQEKFYEIVRLWLKPADAGGKRPQPPPTPRFPFVALAAFAFIVCLSWHTERALQSRPRPAPEVPQAVVPVRVVAPEAKLTITGPRVVHISPPLERTPPPAPPDGAALVVAAALALLLFAVLSLIEHVKILALKRLPIAAAHQKEFFLQDTSAQPGPGEAQMRRLAAQLRQAAGNQAAELDVSATVAATARGGGLFAPVFAPRRQKPEYLCLAERRSFDDHLWRLASGLIAKLKQLEVPAEEYSFRDDPRVCQRPGKPLRHYRLQDLASDHQHSTLFLFIPTSRCFDPITGEPAEWLDLLANWPRRVLFTPEPPYRWTEREVRLAEKGLIVLPTGAAGLSRLADVNDDWRINSLFPAPYARAFPSFIGGSWRRWLHRSDPPREDVELLVGQLEAYLGPKGFPWLCACAVYPEIRWDLTLRLDGVLHGGGDGIAVRAGELQSLARLPWLREGYMPDWLRRALIRKLAPEQDRLIREDFAQLLTEVAARAQVPQLAASDTSALRISGWTLAEALLKTAPPDSPLLDCIFIGFISRSHKDPLAVRLLRALHDFKGLRRLPENSTTDPTSRPRRLLRMAFFRPTLLRCAASLLLGVTAFAAGHYLPPQVATKREAAQTSISFSGDGRRVVAAFSDATARIFDAGTGRELARLTEDGGPIISAVFSGDGKHVVTTSTDGTARIWGTGGFIMHAGHRGVVSSAAFSPDGRRVVTAGTDSTARVWKVTPDKELLILRHSAPVSSAAFSRDGRLVVTASGNSAHVWDLTGEELATLEGGGNKVAGATFSPDGGRIVASSGNRAIVWGDVIPRVHIPGTPSMYMPWGIRPLLLTGHTDAVHSAAFSPDGRYIVTASQDKSVKVWAAADGKLLTTIRDSRPIWSASFSSDGKAIIAAGAGNRIVQWQVSAEPVSVPRKEPSSATPVPDPPGRRIAPKVPASTTQKAVMNHKPPAAPVEPKPERQPDTAAANPKQRVVDVLFPEVPNLLGRSKTEAQEMLRKIRHVGGSDALGTEVQIETGSGSPGTVIEQNPQPGARLNPYQRVDIAVAVPPSTPKSTMPDVVRLPVEDARARLKAAGVTDITVAEVGSSEPPGTVLSQDPPANASLLRTEESAVPPRVISAVRLIIAAPHRGEKKAPPAPSGLRALPVW